MTNKIFIAFITLCFFVQISVIFGQETDSVLYKQYNFFFKNNTIMEMVDSIKIKANLGFSYNPNYVPKQKRHTYTFNKCPLNVILDSIFKPCHITYKLIGTTIAISREEKLPPTENITFNSEPIDSVTNFQIEGILKDQVNNEPIPFANIFLKSRQIGTISNNDGVFFIKIPVECKNDTLNFSFIGFTTASIPIPDLLTTNNVITLDPTTIRLKEVIIRYADPNELLQKVINNIAKNYSSEPQLATGFYRETIKQNGEYVALTEAVIKIYKASYQSLLSDQATIYKGRKMPFLKKMDTIFFKLQGGVHTSFMLDIAKNHSSFISGEFAQHYKYKFEGITTFQGRDLYIISFDQKDDISYPLYKGKLYIDTETLGLVKADFGLSPKGISYAGMYMVKKSPPGVKVKPVEANYLVSYTFQNNIWNLSYIRESLKFKIRKRFNLFNMTFQLTAELAITQIDSIASRRFKYSQTVKSNDVFDEKVTEYDPQFWEDFNYIPPDKTLEEAFAELRAKTAKLN